jgi:hypothetical protein
MEILEAHPYLLRVKLVQAGLLVDVSSTAHGAIYHIRSIDGKPHILPLNRRCKLAKDDCVNAKGEFTGNSPFCHEFRLPFPFTTDAKNAIIF